MSRSLKAAMFAAWVAFTPIAQASAETLLPSATRPEDVGLSGEQLVRLEAVTRGHIENGLLPGAIMLVVRDGKVAWHRVLGMRDRDKGEPLKPDSLFRIYSMTKPIVSVAIMMLVEQGRMQIGDPVSRYIPEFAEMKVGVEKTGTDGKPLLELAAAQREMTVQDLLRHTSGLIYGTRGDSLVNKAYREARIGDRTVDNAEFARQVSKLPLRFSPGTRWEYGVSTDILGRIVEVVTGKSLGVALDETIFRPLGMVDTAFVLPPGKLARAAQPAVSRKDRPPTPRFDVGVRAAFESGGGGLVGSTDDYLRFMLMLANGGTFNGRRLLGAQTIEFMTADHVGMAPGRPPGMGFGLGFEVRKSTGMAALPGSVGEYGWAGNAGTLFWIDPKRRLMALYMVQVNDYDRIFLRNQFRTMVQAAIIR
ncbi:MAG: beta-lactamase family protein [Alphaproteobacteria bacterium]|nr:beta-lactamase family protein [Alphaproteobacteria bacterium]MCW5742827.1 beta-lactamase family protein [Alphaproteobacteria bacterium]